MNVSIRIKSDEKGVDFCIPIQPSSRLDRFAQDFLEICNEEGVPDLNGTKMLLLANSGRLPISIDLLVQNGDLLFKETS